MRVQNYVFYLNCALIHFLDYIILVFSTFILLILIYLWGNLFEMSTKLLKESSRLQVVDALRGFALLAIVLIHNIEHYNLIAPVPYAPEWLKGADTIISNVIMFLLAGKAYATFSLLFGFSFYIQLSKRQARGESFKGRFAWRMVLLILFSQLHALFYNGDILFLYALMGFVLILVCDSSNRTVFIIATICLLQPVEWIRVICGFIYPDVETYGMYFYKYFQLALPVMKDGTFFEILYSNITDGQLYSNLWQVENGRLFQIPALFMFGMLLGRCNYFIKSENSIRAWKRILLISAIAFIPLYLLSVFIPDMTDIQAVKTPLHIILPSFFNFNFMALLVSAFVLFWFQKDGYKFQRFIIPYGRMSLTNYIGQSIIGSILYLGYGFALAQYAGATISILIAIGIFTIQWLFSSYWLSTHKQGPLETLWRRGTWCKNPFRK